MRQTIYYFAELLRDAGCTRAEAKRALLTDCWEEAEFIELVLTELWD